MKSDPLHENTRSTIWFIAIVAGSLLLFHLFLKFRSDNIKDGLDAVALGLIAVGLTPWLARVLESFKFGGVELHFVKQQIDEQKKDIDAIKFLLFNHLTRGELSHLNQLSTKTGFTRKKTDHLEIFQSELRHLRGLGLIANNVGKTLASMSGDSQDDINVHDYVYITDPGKQYLELRSIFSNAEGKADHLSLQSSRSGIPSDTSLA